MILHCQPECKYFLKMFRANPKKVDLCKVMHSSKLQDRSNAVEETADDEPVQGSGIVHLWQVRPAVHGDGGQGQDSCHSSNVTDGRKV